MCQRYKYVKVENTARRMYVIIEQYLMKSVVFNKGSSNQKLVKLLASLNITVEAPYLWNNEDKGPRL